MNESRWKGILVACALCLCMGTATTAVGALVDIALVALDTPSTGDGPIATLPISLTQVDVGATFYVEVWAQTTDSRGLSTVFVDIPFDSCRVTAVSLTNTAAFNFLDGGQGEITPGLIDNLGGNHWDQQCANGFGAGNWVRAGYVEFTADTHGVVILQSANTADIDYDNTICGALGKVDPALVDYGGVSLQSGSYSGDLQLVVQGAPKTVLPGQQVLVDLNVANLTTTINGVQALIHYDTALLTLNSIVPVSPWHHEVTETDTAGDVAYAVGIDQPNYATNGTVATLTFTAVAPGTPVVSFLPDHPDAYPTLCNKLTESAEAEAISPGTTGTSSGDISVVGCLGDGDCNDTIPCTDDACVDYECQNTPNTDPCDDGLYCTGIDTCGGGTCSMHAGDPCAGQICDEDNDRCVDCLGDGDCDDGLWCTGTETCVGGACVAGTRPCGGFCSNSTNTACTTDANCTGGGICIDAWCNEDSDSCCDGDIQLPSPASLLMPISA